MQFSSSFNHHVPGKLGTPGSNSELLREYPSPDTRDFSLPGSQLFEIASLDELAESANEPFSDKPELLFDASNFALLFRLANWVHDHRHDSGLGDFQKTWVSGFTTDTMSAKITTIWDPNNNINSSVKSAAALSGLLVVSGTESKAIATTCRDYMSRVWPLYSEMEFLDAFSAFLFNPYGPVDPREAAYPDDHKFLITMTGPVSTNITRQNERLEIVIEGCVLDIVLLIQQVAWLTAISQHAEEGQLLASTIRCRTEGSDKLCRNVNITPNPPSPFRSAEGCCWHPMLHGNSLAYGFPIPKRNGQLGVEIAFETMAILGLIWYPVNCGKGIVLKGERTALIPCTHNSTEDSIQWHYMENSEEEGKLGWEKIHERCHDILEVNDLDTLSTKTAFVGYFPKANIYLGTDSLDSRNIDMSGAEIDEKQRLSLGNELAIAFGIPGMGILSATGTLKVIVNRLSNDRIEAARGGVSDTLRNTKDQPLLLYDLNTKRSWLVPELSVIAHIARTWALLQTEPEAVLECMPSIQPSPDGGTQACDATLKDLEKVMPKTILSEDDLNEEQNLWKVLKPFFVTLSNIKDHKLAKRAQDNVLWNSLPFFGYEYLEVARHEQLLHPRTVTLNTETAGPWVRLAKARPEMVILLCSNLGEPIQLSGRPACNQWEKVPTGQDYMTSTVSILKYLTRHYGGPASLKLHGDLYCHLSSADGVEKTCEDKSPCCNHLLDLKRKPPKQDLPYGQHAAVTFGRHHKQSVLQKVLKHVPTSLSRLPENTISGDAATGEPHVHSTQTAPLENERRESNGNSSHGTTTME